LNQPFGTALAGETFYVGNTDGIIAFPYVADTARVTGPCRKLVDFKPGGHWTRSLLKSPDGEKLYAGVGSLSNIGDEGMAAEDGRAAIYENQSHPAQATTRPSSSLNLLAPVG
jgi:glucose/arabinose dehydrogenase